MLRELKIENLALIEELAISFDTEPAGLSVLTGETGAGKSIILQAIHLLSGGKGSAAWVRAGAESTTVEAYFTIDPKRSPLGKDLEEMDIDPADGLVIKRILAPKGRSRYYINGNIANAGMVSRITGRILSIASQHEHQQLLDPRQHLDFIDAVGDLFPRRRKFSDLYARWQELHGTFRKLTSQEKEKEKKRDFLQFQCREILDAGIQLEKDNELGTERSRFKASDTLMQLGRDCAGLLDDEVTVGLAQARKLLDRMAELDQSISPLAAELSGSFFELEDQAARLNDYLTNIPNDPSRLEEIEARIDLLQRLKRKYAENGGSLEDILQYAADAEQELAELDSMDEKIDATAKALEKTGQELLDKAAKLSSTRHKTAKKLAADLKKELSTLDFEKAGFAVHFHPAKEAETPGLQDITETGWDRPEFMFTANPGEPLKPLAKVASGGELSRLMLGLRCLLARRDQVETVILDEIDAGIGGRAAESIADKIKELAGHHQVLCISHLPQIASRADEHFRVSKKVTAGRTNTFIARLNGEDRVDELGRMLAGGSATEDVLSYARELLKKHQ